MVVDLDELHDGLSDRDLAILADVERFRLLGTRQIQRLHFAEHETHEAAARACTRVLGRLREHRLVSCLDRRIGGVRKGSAGLVWYLGPSGERLQRHLQGLSSRRRFGEPSRHFVQHTLAVAELAVQTTEASRAGAFEIVRLASEPTNWESFLGSTGTTQILKPDLALVTTSEDFEDHWFIEADMATEHQPVVIRQCVAYETFRSSGRYQAVHNVFPRVLWVAPTPERAEAMRKAIKATKSLDGDLFKLCTVKDFKAVISDGKFPTGSSS